MYVRRIIGTPNICIDTNLNQALKIIYRSLAATFPQCSDIYTHIGCDRQERNVIITIIFIEKNYIKKYVLSINNILFRYDAIVTANIALSLSAYSCFISYTLVSIWLLGVHCKMMNVKQGTHAIEASQVVHGKNGNRAQVSEIMVLTELFPIHVHFNVLPNKEESIRTSQSVILPFNPRSCFY